MAPDPQSLDRARELFREAAQVFADHQYAMAGEMPQRTGAAAADVVTPAPGEVLVIRMPSHTDPHVLADLTRFVQSQLDGAAIPVSAVVVAADSVTTEQGG